MPGLLTRVEAVTAGPGRLTRVEGVAAGATLDGRLTRVEGVATSVGAYGVTTRVAGQSAQYPVLIAGSTRSVEPYTDVQLVASSDDPTDNITWAQVPGPGQPTVTLTGPSAVVSYTTPATFDGVDLLFECTCTRGAMVVTARVTHHIYPHTVWRIVSGQAAPSRWS